VHAPPDPPGQSKPWHGLVALIPGLLLTAAIAVLSITLRQLPGIGAFSPMILAIVIGMAFHNLVGTPRRAHAGVKFTLRRVLRFAIILLGLQLTFTQVAAVGLSGLTIIAVSLGATFLFTKWLGRRLGVERKLAELIAAGTSICGASAIVATNTVTDGSDEDVAYAVACVTLFGSIAMFGYPLLPGLLRLSPHAFGLWSGASIHEIAQVLAAAYQDGTSAGQFAAIAKLSRVMLLAPVVILLGLWAERRRLKHAHGHVRSARAPMPWFVLGFIALIGLNSLVTVSAGLKTDIAALASFLLAMALAAMGLEADIRKLHAKGLRPLLLGLAAFLFIAVLSLTLVRLTA
jgi:uncharacterized integral membrane protein (TIGR00698 family)